MAQPRPQTVGKRSRMRGFAAEPPKPWTTPNATSQRHVSVTTRPQYSQAGRALLNRHSSQDMARAHSANPRRPPTYAVKQAWDEDKKRKVELLTFAPEKVAHNDGTARRQKFRPAEADPAYRASEAGYLQSIAERDAPMINSARNPQTKHSEVISLNLKTRLAAGDSAQNADLNTERHGKRPYGPPSGRTASARTGGQYAAPIIRRGVFQGPSSRSKYNQT